MAGAVTPVFYFVTILAAAARRACRAVSELPILVSGFWFSQICYNRLLVPCLSCGIIMARVKEQERRLRLVRLSRILFNKPKGLLAHVV